MPCVRFHQDLADLLGNAEFSVEDRPAEPLTAAVVVANVTSVGKGAGVYVRR